MHKAKYFKFRGPSSFSCIYHTVSIQPMRSLVCVLHHSIIQSCPTLYDPMDFVHEIFQSRILEWLAIFLLQGIFLILGLNPCLLCLLHWQTDYLSLVLPDWHHQGLNLALQADSLPSEPQGSPWETKDRGK